MFKKSQNFTDWYDMFSSCEHKLTSKIKCSPIFDNESIQDEVQPLKYLSTACAISDLSG